MSKDVVTGLNINKNGSDPPLKSDEELPDWLWKLALPDKSLAELRRTNADDLDFEDVRHVALLFSQLFVRLHITALGTCILHHQYSLYVQLKRLSKLRNRDDIRTRNASKAK